MTNTPPPNFAPLTEEQLAALDEAQRAIFLQLVDSDRRFFAANFAPPALGTALERKQRVMQEHAALDDHDRQVRLALQARSQGALPSGGLSAGEVAAGAAGAAGLVGMGVLARKIAPQGEAAWRGVRPRDLVDPLVRTFARQQRTDIRFDPPDSAGTLHATVLLRSGSGMLPALNISLTPLDETLQVKISEISKQSLLETFKSGGQSLVSLAKDALRLGTRGGIFNMLDLAGEVMNHGTEIAQAVNDLDLEDKAWQAIQRAADPLQAVYDEQAAIERDENLKLELAWDDYISCPRCRVEFGDADLECRVCGAARPERPARPDPRKN